MLHNLKEKKTCIDPKKKRHLLQRNLFLPVEFPSNILSQRAKSRFSHDTSIIFDELYALP